MKNNDIFNVACLCLGAMFLAVGGVFVRVSEIPPTSSAFYRVLLAAPLFYLAYLWSKKKEPDVQIPVKDRFRFILLGCIFSGNLVTYHWSIEWSTLTNSSLLANTAPIFVALISVIFLKKIYGLKLVLCILICFIGVILILKEDLVLSSENFRGDILGLVSGFFYGLYFIYLSKVRGNHNIYYLMAFSCIGTSIVILPISIFMGEALVPETIQGVGSLILLAVISHFFGQGLIAYAMGNLPIMFSSLTLLVQVIFSYSLGVYMYNETFNNTVLLGFLLVTVGILFSKKYSRG